MCQQLHKHFVHNAIVVKHFVHHAIVVKHFVHNATAVNGNVLEVSKQKSFHVL
jgi:hypothetical protein